jgi:hypothetical protein
MAPAGPPRVSAGVVRPSAWWFGVAGLLALGGLVAGVVIIVRGVVGFQDRVEDFDRGDVPVTLEVTIADTGGYSIYHEYEGADEEFLAPEPDVSVIDPSGDDVPLERYDGTVTYAVGRHEGEGIWTFDADEPGVYEVTATGDTGTGIAVGRGLGAGLVGAIVGGIAVGFVGVVAAVVLAIVVGVRRGRSRRALLPPPRFSGWGAPPPPGWGAPPPPPPTWWTGPPPPTAPGPVRPTPTDAPTRPPPPTDAPPA